MRGVEGRKKKPKGPGVPAYGARVTIVAGGLGIFLAICVARVGFLQLVQGEELREEAKQWQSANLKFHANRGRITDRNGNVLAMSVKTKGIEVFRPGLKHPDYVVDFVSGILAISRKEALHRVQCKGKYCYVERFLDPKLAEPLEKVLNYKGDDPQLRWQKEMLSGVRIVPAAGRVYPFGELAGQVLGVARVPQARKGLKEMPSPMELEGQYGIEAAYNEALSGRSVVHKGLKLKGSGPTLFADNPDPVLKGGTVVLTLDVNIQRIAEDELQRMVISTLAWRGVAMVMDVETGELLAVAHYPPFNPNATSKYRSDELWKWNDWAFTAIFEPGSIIKPLIIAAAIEEGVITIDDLIFCENGSWKLDPRAKPIRDHEPYGFLTVWEVLKFSSNICAGKVGLMLGGKKLYEFLKRFGLGKKTGIKPDGREAKGIINKDGKGWSDMEIANISFGQGIAVTPIQILTAIAALGNKGHLMRPLLVREVRDSRGEVLERFEPEVMGHPVSEAVARQVVQAMMHVVEPGGTAERAAVFGYDVAGKTGTAQKVMTVKDPHWRPGDQRKHPLRKSAYVDKWVASFVGLIPADKPKLAILVAIDEPYLTHSAGLVAAPVFSKIASRTMSYLGGGVSKEEQCAKTAKTAPGREEEAEKEVGYPRGGSESLAVGPVVVVDFKGMTPGAALKVAMESGLKLAAEGAGIAVRQVPPPHTTVRRWEEVQVVFER